MRLHRSVARCFTFVTVAAVIGLGLVAGPARADSGPANSGTERVERTAGPETMPAAPYIYLNSTNQSDPVEIMNATGVRWFTAAFIVAPDPNTCSPEWDGQGALTGPVQDKINAIRAAGGDIIPSFGGGGVVKLGQACSTAAELAAAYQQVIDTYALKAVDLDIEGDEFHDVAARQRNIDALKILQDNNPGLAVFITIPVLDSGFSGTGETMVTEAAAADLDVTAWAGMAFYLGKGDIDMGDASIRAMDGMRASVQEIYGYSEQEAYRRIGLSSLAGVNGSSGETITVADFHQVLAYAFRHQIGRFTFWTVNRDRACRPDHTDLPDTCSGVQQRSYDYARLVARYHRDPAPPAQP